MLLVKGFREGQFWNPINLGRDFPWWRFTYPSFSPHFGEFEIIADSQFMQSKTRTKVISDGKNIFVFLRDLEGFMNDFKTWIFLRSNIFFCIIAYRMLIFVPRSFNHILNIFHSTRRRVKWLLETYKVPFFVRVMLNVEKFLNSLSSLGSTRTNDRFPQNRNDKW